MAKAPDLLFTSYSSSNDVVLFDPVNNKVHKVQITGTEPQARHAHTVCVYKNQLIIFGGDDVKGGGASFGASLPTSPTDEVATMSLDTIELLSAEWKIVKSGNRHEFARSYHTAHIVEDYMYVYGGEAGPTRKLTNQLIRFNLNTLVWSRCQVTGSLPAISKNKFSVLLQKKMYVCEIKATPCYNEFYILDLEKLNWERIGFKQTKGFAAISTMQNVGSDIYVFGNVETKTPSSKDVLIYNTNRDVWQTYETEGDVPLGDSPLKAVCHQNQIIVFEKDSAIYSLPINSINSMNNSSGRNNQTDLEYINQMRKLLFDKLYSDITFIVQGQQLTAHKNILAARCKYFCNMFTSGMTESQTSKIEISDVQAHTFKALLEFIYCNEVKLDQNLALEVLEVSDKYSFNELKNVCESFLALHLSLENYVKLANASEKYDANELREKVVQFVIKNKAEIEKKEMAGNLSTDLLWEIIFKMNHNNI